MVKPNFENLSFADNALIMLFKSRGQFAIETYQIGSTANARAADTKLD